ncbi:MAG: sel1 repeat family protein [Sulfuriferula sp.]|nr:sel1 repeat family protein [Sulfuriferula sp.]
MDILELAGYAPLKQLTADAQNGDVNAQYNLGVLYFEGKDVPQDYVEAAKWYGAAADQGDKQAQFNLGLMFYRGIGLPQNYLYAYELFELGAHQGDDRAQQGMTAILAEAPADIVAQIKARTSLFN